MLRPMLTSALFAGFVAGLFAALLHFAFVQDKLLLGELYESGERVHFDLPAPTHDHAEGTGAQDHGTDTTGVAHDHSTHDHGPPASDLQRNALTVAFASAIYIGYALMLVAGFALLAQFGRTITVEQGVLWGIGGFVAFQLAPAMGLAPELPGTIAADLGARQVWWWGTAIATGLGLLSLGYGKGIAAIGLGAILLTAPHVIGAPVPDTMSGVAPPELAAEFAARVLGVALAVWAVLGWLAARFWLQFSAQ